MENDQTPGRDGICIEFYKELYRLAENNFLQLYNSILFIEQKPIKAIN